MECCIESDGKGGMLHQRLTCERSGNSAGKEFDAEVLSNVRKLRTENFMNAAFMHLRKPTIFRSHKTLRMWILRCLLRFCYPIKAIESCRKCRSSSVHLFTLHAFIIFCQLRNLFVRGLIIWLIDNTCRHFVSAQFDEWVTGLIILWESRLNICVDWVWLSISVYFALFAKLNFKLTHWLSIISVDLPIRPKMAKNIHKHGKFMPVP